MGCVKCAMSHSRRYELNLAAVGDLIARRLIHGCAVVCSRLSPGDVFAMPTLLHVAASARLFLDAWHTLPRLGLILIAWRAWFDLAAFWISGIHARALAAFGRLTFVGCFDAGCRAFRLRCFCALVSENATRGPDCSPIFVAKGAIGCSRWVAS